jgi:anaerobic magnesium-protoporphyrin IX monomethyl ester cyclase
MARNFIAPMNLVGAQDFSQAGIVPKKVALVACPWTFFGDPEFLSQQLGLGYVGAYAEKFGHRVEPYVDPMLEGGIYIKERIKTKYQETNRCGHPDSWIVERIPLDVDVIGISAPFTDSRIVLYPLVRLLKCARPKARIVIGGVLATTLPRQVIEESGADVVVKGEGEIPFSKILNGVPLADIPGLVYRCDDGTIAEHPLRSEQLKGVNQIPPPGYGFRPMHEYVRWSPRGDRHQRTLSIISSRGCPFTCEFCSIPEKGQLWRPFTPERVLEEIKHAIREWGVNHIEFEDDNFTLKEPRALQVLGYLKELRNRGEMITCSFPNGIMIDKMTESLASLLYDAGADIIYLPVESGDTRVLYAMDKPMAEHHLEKTLTVAKWCVDAGLRVSCFFIVAYPGGRLNAKYAHSESMHRAYGEYIIRDRGEVFMRGEDRQSFETTMGFARKLRSIGVEGITPLIATPYPGTELYDVCERFGWLAYPDEPNALTTVSYAAVTPDRVQIETPWCSREEAYQRWKEMMAAFPTYHNVRRNEAEATLQRGAFTAG